MRSHKIILNARCLFILFVVLCAVQVLSACKTLDQPGPRLGVRETCDPGILYQGRSYAGNAAYGLLGIQAASGVQAVRNVSDIVQVYLHQSAALCEERERGTLNPQDYLDRRNMLSEKFAKFASFTQEIPPADVRQVETAIYSEAVATYNPAVTAQPIQAAMQVIMKDGRILPNGGSLNSGDSFRVEIDLSRQAYLYLVIKDSSGNMYKLYPSQAAGGFNPAQGRVNVPQDGLLTLDNIPGTETIYLFAGDRSPALESGLEEIGTAPKSPETQTVLASAVRFRGVFVNKNQSTPGGALSIEALGQAAAVFTIEHR